jgi:hypothetical protein
MAFTLVFKINRSLACFLSCSDYTNDEYDCEDESFLRSMLVMAFGAMVLAIRMILTHV